MSLVLSVGVILGFVFLLPVLQQGAGLVVAIFFMSVGTSFLVGVFGYVWYGFSLFLIYVGRLLVIFGYVVAMRPNFLFKRQNYLFFLLAGFLISWLLAMKLDLTEGISDVGGFLYSVGGYFVLIGLGLVLFFALVCVVKVCYFNKGSLRPFSF